jgi:hypothetical protein
MLVVDRREIEFDAEALNYYLSASHAEAAALGLPATAASKIYFDAQDGNVAFMFAGPGGVETIELAAEQLGELLIAYCLRTRIPLPRVADKIIRVEPNRIVLAFKTWFTDAPVFAHLEATPNGLEAVRSWHWVEPGRPAQRGLKGR